MKNIWVIIFLLFAAKCTSQSLIDRNKAIQIAQENGITEPIDSLTATLKGDTIWEISSIYCDDYYQSRFVTYIIDAKTGKKLNGSVEGMSLKWHSHPKQKSELNYNFVDSLIPVNINNPKTLIPDYFETESQPIISPDNKWIAFNCDSRSIAIASIDGKEYRKICDSCLYPNWTNKENILVYEKNYKQIYEHNFESNDIKIISNHNSRYIDFSYNPYGKWIAFVESALRESDDSNVLHVSMEGDNYELFIFSIDNNKEKRITHLGNVNGPVWNLSGDTIFFYSNGTAYYATNFNLDKPTYAEAKQIGKTSVWDYANSVNNKFIYKLDGKLLLVDMATLKPIKYVIKKPGRYEDIAMSKDGRYTVYTLIKDKQDKIFIIEN